jgi:tetratricopeptide (TPR) repeat protein
MLGTCFAESHSAAWLRGLRWTLVSTVWVLSLSAPAAAQSARLKNIQLCNGADRTSVESQIHGCGALIESDGEPPRVLAVAYNNRGNAYLRQGEYARSIQEYNQAIKIIPNYAVALNNRGVALQKLGQSDRAIQDLDLAIKLNRNYANALANRAEIYLNMNEYQRAAADYDEAIRLQPTSNSLIGRCRARVIMGELQTAFADCK